MQDAKWAESNIRVSEVQPAPSLVEQETGVRVPLSVVDAIRTSLEPIGVPLLLSIFGTWAILVSRWSAQDDELLLRVRFNESHDHGRDLEVIGLAVQRALLDGTLNYREFCAELKTHLEVQAASLLAAFQAGRAITVENDDTQSEFSLSLRARNELSGVVRISVASDSGRASRMATAWQLLLGCIADEPDRPVRDAPILTAEERERVLYSYNRAATDFPESRLIHELFEEQVARNPRMPAVVFNGSQITYERLNRRANQLARYLAEQGVQPKQIIAVCMDRGVDVIAALLAVLKVGAAYLPLDPAYPEERLDYMLSDARPALLLTDRSTQAKFSRELHSVVVEDALQSIAEYNASNLPRPFQSASELAYIIYTSGSTGRPKGAMNEHRGMVNRIASQLHVEAMTSSDVCCQTTSISFVDAVLEIFGPLCNGQLLVVVPDDVVRDFVRLATVISERRITRLVTVPSLARAMLNMPAVMSQLSDLASWTLSGEEVQPDLLVSLQQCLPACEFIIQYGSSEVSSDAAIYKSRSFSGTRVPIGKPLQNVRIYVLDSRGEPVPTGVPGEICVAGVGVGRGYLNHPELTAPRFSTDPFTTDRTQRLYRMGDLGRWRHDGMLEYLGRKDHQVKVRGFRVELGEIERQLLKHALVREAAVIAREDVPGEKRLVAYAALRTHGDESHSSTVGQRALPAQSPLVMLRSHLKAVLPDYMMPSAIVVMAELPKTPNGKLDRRSLPAPNIDAFSSNQYEAPRGELEQSVASVWQDLLHVERIGRRDNFFEVGGHSLAVVQLMDGLRQIGLTADARAIYAKPTLLEFVTTVTRRAAEPTAVPESGIPVGCDQISPSMLPLVQLGTEHIKRIVSAVPGGARNVQDIYPLAPNQEGILFHCSLGEVRADTYVLATAWSFRSQARLDEFVRVMQSLIDRHDVLRTAIHWEQLPRAVQVVHRKATLVVEKIRLRDGLEPPMSRLLGQWRDEHAPMDLRTAPLIRLLITADPTTHHHNALLLLHHIIIDDVSLDLLLSEIVASLNGTEERTADALPYRAHVVRVLESSHGQKVEEFFKEKLGDIQEPTAPFALLGVRGEGTELLEARERMEPVLEKRARAQARRLGISMATLFHAAWSLVAAHTSGRDDVVFGTVLLGRLQSNGGTRRSLGMFVNTLPLRLRLVGVTARELVEQTQREVVALLGYESVSLAVAQRCSGVPASHPLFTSLLNYRQSNFGTVEPHAEDIELFVCQNRTNYPISVSIDDSRRGIEITAQTDRSIDPPRIIGHLVEGMRSLVNSLEENPQVLALDLSVLPARELDRVLRDFNATRHPYDTRTVVHLLIDEQRRRTPDAVAIRQGEQSVTYAQLVQRAEHWAAVLYQSGLGRLPNERIAVYLERGISMVVSQLAILKLGAAFVPLDPTQPAERVAYMIRDCRPAAIVTEKHLSNALAVEDSRVHLIDDLPPSASGTAQEIGSVVRDIDPAERAAYVIYTSGSTGAPKGVVVSHRGLMNLIAWHRDTFELKPGCQCSSLAAVGFDATVWEIWPALSSGATVVLAPANVSGDIGALLAWWRSEPLDISFLPTPIAEVVFRENIRHDTLRVLLVGGDTLRQMPQAPTYRVVNNYGPTECTVVATSGQIQLPAARLHIGRPIANTQAYILDRGLRPVPIEVVGELYVGGDGIAVGYLGRPELTAERFLKNPFVNEPAARIYRTGDLARWRPDGTIEYLGRNDQQVKIRGNRVELGEIEAHLLRVEAVKEAAVLAREDAFGEKRLIAYIVPRDAERFSTAELRDQLKQALPVYMIPAVFAVLERLPISANGKLDRSALAMQSVSIENERDSVPAATQMQRILCDIWSQVLPVKSVGVEDNFFELGGHSINAMTLVARISEHFNVELPVTTLFRNPTVRQLTAFLDSGQVPQGAPPEELEFQEGTV